MAMIGADNIADIIARITKPAGRKSVYHFTRAKNLPAISHFDSLWSSHRMLPLSKGDRREKPKEIFHEGFAITVNAHLRIPVTMMEPSCTVEQFRSCLDRHVFFWPTRQDCLKMLDTYKRREPSERYAVLELEADSLLSAHAPFVRLSKYDSGSSPRFPKRCLYRKSPDMFVPLADFGRKIHGAVPVKTSEIKEILIEDHVGGVTRFLKAVYVDHLLVIPVRWATIPHHRLSVWKDGTVKGAGLS